MMTYNFQQEIVINNDNFCLFYKAIVIHAFIGNMRALALMKDKSGIISNKFFITSFSSSSPSKPASLKPVKVEMFLFKLLFIKMSFDALVIFSFLIGFSNDAKNFSSCMLAWKIINKKILNINYPKRKLNLACYCHK